MHAPFHAAEHGRYYVVGAPPVAWARMLGAIRDHLSGGVSSSVAVAGAGPDRHTGKYVMANTVIMPSVGLGGAFVDGSDGSSRSQAEITTDVVEQAIACGYRLFDTAQRYGTEGPLGATLKRHFDAGSLSRHEVFITTKTSNPRPGSGGMPAGGGWVPDGNGYMLDDAVDARAGIIAELEGCLRTLQVEYVDLCLIHYPSLPASDSPSLTKEQCQRKRRECWAGLQDLYNQGKCRAIGTSNFGINHLQELFSWDGLTVQPMVNQVQLHTKLAQVPLVEYCHAHNMLVTAFCPISGSDLSAPPLLEIAAAHGVTPSAVVLRWLMQRGIAAIPKTHRADRLQANLTAHRGWSLDKSEMARISALDEGDHCRGDDPATML